MDIRAMEESFAKASGFLLCVKGGCIMATIRDMLDTKIKHELNSMVSPKKKKKKKEKKKGERRKKGEEEEGQEKEEEDGGGESFQG